MAKTIQLCKVH